MTMLTGTASTSYLDFLAPDVVFMAIFVIIAIFLVIASAGGRRRQTAVIIHGKSSGRHTGLEFLKKTALSTVSAVIVLILSRWIVNEGGADMVIEAARELVSALLRLLDASP